MAMPWGRSVVTLQGPSLARRSASARRWRMDSSVQASLRTMAECRASASASETRVMGMPAAWAHDTSVTTRTAVFTITDCSGYDLGRWENGCATQKWQIARVPFLWHVSECFDTLSVRRPPLYAEFSGGVGS